MYTLLTDHFHYSRADAFHTKRSSNLWKVASTLHHSCTIGEDLHMLAAPTISDRKMYPKGKLPLQCYLDNRMACKLAGDSMLDTVALDNEWQFHFRQNRCHGNETSDFIFNIIHVHMMDYKLNKIDLGVGHLLEKSRHIPILSIHDARYSRCKVDNEGKNMKYTQDWEYGDPWVDSFTHIATWQVEKRLRSCSFLLKASASTGVKWFHE